jgi:lipopolysaccharide export system protein LptA|tara:strand:+ start:77 stop:316 length:240 start_codon:yes stop_codon:yes gene_type:complete
MSTLKANIVESTAVTTEFKDVITANGDKQWVDSYGIIKTNRDTISEDVVIPSGSNGLSSGPVTIASGYTVTVNGEWAIV